MARPKKPEPPAQPQPATGFASPPADGGLSIDKLAQAFAAMMGTADPLVPAAGAESEVVHVDASPDLDDADDPAAADAHCRVSPLTILEALLFVGLPGGRPISSRTVAGLMRGVRPQEVDDLVQQLRQRYRADNCPFEVASRDDGWVLRLRPEFARFGSVLEAKVRQVRLDAEALDVLAAVAWNQPVPRDKLVELGCDAGPAVLRQLVRRGLLELTQADDAGPCYRTTPKFLEVFKLASVDDLPAPTDPPQ
ncbi:MAG: SMC-Scp complex subunit ScpB [Planctomycetaceae bacterium]